MGRDSPSRESVDLTRFPVTEDASDSAALFIAMPRGDVCWVRLNSFHPAFALLAELVPRSRGFVPVAELQEQVERLRLAVHLLIAGWIEYEHNISGACRRRVEDAREDWGREVRNLLCDPEMCGW